MKEYISTIDFSKFGKSRLYDIPVTPALLDHSA
jgi:hypothetical protein